MVRLFRTISYIKSLKHLPNAAKIEQAELEIEKNPKVFPVIPGSGGLRKARFGTTNAGKSGGGRIIFAYVVQHERIYLIRAYAKSKQTNLTASDIKSLKEVVKIIKRTELDHE